MSKPILKLRHDLGYILEVTNEHGTKAFYPLPDIILIEQRITGVYITIRGHNDEFWVGNRGSGEGNVQYAEELAGMVASSRIDAGIDRA